MHVAVEQTEFPFVEPVVVHTFNLIDGVVGGVKEVDVDVDGRIDGIHDVDDGVSYFSTNFASSSSGSGPGSGSGSIINGSTQTQNENHVNKSQRNQLERIHAGLRYILNKLNTSKQMPRVKYYIATDSKFAIRCITHWSIKWIQHNWINSRGYQVDNKDVLIEILDVVDEINDLYFKLQWGKLEFKVIDKLPRDKLPREIKRKSRPMSMSKSRSKLSRDQRRDSMISNEVAIEGGDGSEGFIFDGAIAKESN
ncbi:unnamed protein product [Ambrosiozyma monospora]|uniref:Unnamed protein product n=1 Tax=Ambrosiozyma monospora TaxID=43982 RepID=A0A9W6T3Z3_AMBMO|nr:unnamed protein product [Ambrosiozyma monospora]